MKTMVWSVALCGAESWIIRNADRKIIETSETWY